MFEYTLREIQAGIVFASALIGMGYGKALVNEYSSLSERILIPVGITYVAMGVGALAAIGVEHVDFGGPLFGPIVVSCGYELVAR